MEKEQIVKALECCTRGRKSKKDRPCLECHYNECNLVGGTGERQISGTCQGWLMKDALSLILEQDKRIEEIKAETVRKMRESIKERCIKGGIYPAFVARTVEAVADELLENAAPTNLVSLEDVSKAIKDYCCELIDQGKDAVEVTEFNADLQSIPSKNRRKA